MDSIFNILVENALNERLDSLVEKDEILRQCDRRFDELNEQFKNASIREEDRKTISELLDTQAEHSARYTELAYRQAINDVVDLLKDMRVLVSLPNINGI